jgi:hypothetical protein
MTFLIDQQRVATSNEMFNDLESLPFTLQLNISTTQQHSHQNNCALGMIFNCEKLVMKIPETKELFSKADLEGRKRLAHYMLKNCTTKLIKDNVENATTADDEEDDDSFIELYKVVLPNGVILNINDLEKPKNHQDMEKSSPLIINYHK